MSRFQYPLIAAVLAVGFFSTSPVSAQGIQKIWFTGFSATWQDDVLWSPVGMPGVLDTALFNQPTGYLVDLNAVATCEGMVVKFGKPSLDLDLFPLNLHFMKIGDLELDDGFVEVTHGLLDVTAGLGSTFIQVGVEGGSTGEIEVTSDGTMQSSVPVIVGDGGDGIVEVFLNGTVITTGLLVLADDLESTAIVLIEGPFSSWTAHSESFVGNFGSATVDVLAGGTFNTSRVKIADEIGSFGVVTVDGVGTTWNDTVQIISGNFGTGTLNIQNGAIVTTPTVTIGDDPGSSGLVVVTGPGSTLNAASQTIIGNAGSGVLRLDGGTAGASSFAVSTNGRLEGAGTLNGPLTNDGVVAVSGPLSVNGTLNQGLAARVEVTVDCGGDDGLMVNGTANLGGTLEIIIDNAFPPLLGQDTVVFSASAIVGSFASIVAPPTLSVDIIGNTIHVTALTGPTGTSDINGNGVVDISDLLVLLGSWGICAKCPADLNGDGLVGVVDLLQLLASWGNPC